MLQWTKVRFHRPWKNNVYAICLNLFFLHNLRKLGFHILPSSSTHLTFIWQICTQTNHLTFHCRRMALNFWECYALFLLTLFLYRLPPRIQIASDPNHQNFLSYSDHSELKKNSFGFCSQLLQEYQSVYRKILFGVFFTENKLHKYNTISH